MIDTAAIRTRRRAEQRTRLPWWAAALLIYAATRVVTTALLLWVGTQGTPDSRAGADPSLTDLTTAWDGQWYWLIGTDGYPAQLPVGADGAVVQNPWAFLPVYPMLVRLLTLGLLPWPAVAFVVSLLAGFGAAVLLALLLLPRIGRSKALFAVAVLGCSPLAFVLQMAYAESLALALLLGALVLVDRHRYLPAIPLAVVLAFTRPGVLALALAVGVHLVVRIVAAHRVRMVVPVSQLAAGAAFVAATIAAGFAWILVAAAVTGRPDAYFATEAAWRVLWMPDAEIRLFQPWIFAAEYWSNLLLGPGPTPFVAPAAVVLVVLLFAGALFTRPVKRLGPLVRLWLASYALYLLAVFFPQSSVFRLLMPMAPLAGAITPASRVGRVAVLAVSTALQALWMWVVLGPFQTYWSVP